MRSRTPRRRYPRRSRLYWFVRRYGFVVVALAALASIQLVSAGVITVDDTSTSPLSTIARVKWVVPQF